ncbi:hypothetical protein F4824DRAFT_504240 [Ustulina deusta]|nr:hypothetical protein F4824DRAFT_504240 [Ustulina deusta]
MAGTRHSFPPDRVTFEGYCEDWTRWMTELENIKSQRTDQEELSAFQADRDIIQSEIQQLQGRLQQRLQDHETATKENQQLFRARLRTHLRNIPRTDMLHFLREASLGEDHDQAPLCMSSDGIQDRDAIAEAVRPAELPWEFQQTLEADIAPSVETTVLGRENPVESMGSPPPSGPEHPLSYNQKDSSAQKKFRCLEPECDGLGWARPEHLNRHLLMYYALPFS